MRILKTLWLIAEIAEDPNICKYVTSRLTSEFVFDYTICNGFYSCCNGKPVTTRAQTRFVTCAVICSVEYQRNAGSWKVWGL
eukprot:4994989-Amphidinium_carterae.1